MAKAKKEHQKIKIVLGMNDLSVETLKAVSGLTELLYGYQKLTVDALLARFAHIKGECGGDAMITLTHDDYYGSSADILWTRDETDDEFEKRLAKNAKVAETRRKRRAAEKIQKVNDEKAELARLLKKYPEARGAL